jgi:hypothetical protein
MDMKSEGECDADMALPLKWREHNTLSHRQCLLGAVMEAA